MRPVTEDEERCEMGGMFLIRAAESRASYIRSVDQSNLRQFTTLHRVEPPQITRTASWGNLGRSLYPICLRLQHLVWNLTVTMSDPNRSSPSSIRVSQATPGSTDERARHAPPGKSTQTPYISTDSTESNVHHGRFSYLARLSAQIRS